MSRKNCIAGFRPFARCCVLWLATTVGVLATLSFVWGELPTSATLERRRLDAVPFDALLVGGCAVALAACACWLWLVTSLVTLEALTGLPMWRAGCPDRLRRTLLAACGLALVAGVSPVLPASADTSVGLPPTPAGRERTVLNGLQVPDRPSIEDPTHTARAPATRADADQSTGGHAHSGGKASAGRPGADQVRVQPGDTLWGLASARLPETATDTGIDDAWRQIWAANRDLVGDDPDLIHPGSVLRMPDQKEHR
ncbi:MAG: LysM peptidoglycan-binding domain-containing protein [Nocardioides sp.]|nr:LysM peptidoglycan-binding domain-containing protein [Nocardioides sp.]